MTDRESPTTAPKGQPIVQFLCLMTVCYLVGFLGSEGALRGLGDWYLMLIRPSWTPPAWVFSPAWTVQYGLMGGAAWLVWNGTTGTGNDKLLGLWLFGIQLILNGAWPWIFFGNRLIFAGAVDAAALWVVFGLTLWWFRKVNRFSVLLLMPCFLWITYTAAVNFALWGRNR